MAGSRVDRRVLNDLFAIEVYTIKNMLRRGRESDTYLATDSRPLECTEDNKE